MTVHRPSAGVLMPLPAKDNVPESNTLRLVRRSAVGSREVAEGVAARACFSCVACRIAFTATDGYIGPRGEFYCDDCIWILAENGEFL